MGAPEHAAAVLQSEMQRQADMANVAWLQSHPPGTLYDAAVRKATIAHYQRIAASGLQNGVEVAQITQTLRGLGVF
jgi:hypothetical protein